MNTQSALTRIIIAFILILFPNLSYGRQEYFYSTHGQKVFMDIAEDRVVVKPAVSVSVEEVTQALGGSFNNTLVEAVTGLSSEGFYEIRFDSGSMTRQQLTTRLAEMRTGNAWEVVNPVYLIEGSPAIAYDIFVVNLRDESGLKELVELNKKHDVELIERNELIPTMITLRLPRYSEYQVTELARLYYENLDLKWSAPDFKLETVLHGSPNDPYYTYQFYLELTQVDDAWNITLGNSSITVAVVDEGVEVHPDLPASQLVNGYDAFDPTNGDGSPGGNQAHGMASAGIIGANHNTQGIAGIAPKVTIMPVRIFNEYGQGTSSNGQANALTHAIVQSADIISNSWGTLSATGNIPQLTTAIENAMENGRDGKGAIVVFSSGNLSSGGDRTRYPANIDGVIAVGAIDENDVVYYYSCGDNALDLVAPSGDISQSIEQACGIIFSFEYTLQGNVWTLDRDGTPGYNPGNYFIGQPECFNEYLWTIPSGQSTPTNGYTANFGGTSAAAPQVSGIAALILSINSSLTLDQLRNALHSSATKVPEMNGQNFAGFYGYGRVNAYKALIYTIENFGAHLGTEMSQVTLPLYNHLTLQENVSLESGSNLTIESKSGTVSIAAASGTVTIGGSGGAPKIAIGNNSGYDEGTVDNETGETEDPQTVPGKFMLSNNYPNPFNPTTIISYQLPVTIQVTLKVFDMLGREVATLVNGRVSAGQHEVQFDASNLSSGLYIYRLQAGQFVQTKEMMLIK